MADHLPCRVGAVVQAVAGRVVAKLLRSVVGKTVRRRNRIASFRALRQQFDKRNMGRSGSEIIGTIVTWMALLLFEEVEG